MQGQLRGPSTEAECPIRALVRIVRPTRLKLRAKMRQRAQGPTTVGVRFGCESSLGQTDRSWLQPQPFTSPSSKSIQHLPQAPSTPPHTHKQELHHHHSSKLPSPFFPRSPQLLSPFQIPQVSLRRARGNLHSTFPQKVASTPFDDAIFPRTTGRGAAQLIHQIPLCI